MKNVDLERYVDAYRHVCRVALDDTALKRRINQTLRERAVSGRQRPWLWLFGWAACCRHRWRQRRPRAAKWRRGFKNNCRCSSNLAWKLLSVAVPVKRTPPVEMPVSAASEHVEGAPSDAENVAEPDLVAETVAVAVPNLAEVPATLGEDPVRENAVHAERRAVRAAPLVKPNSQSVPASPVVNATALYERAFDLQFSHGNYRAAIAAWDDYLAAASGGALLGEARFIAPCVWSR